MSITADATVTSKGQVTIPKEIRDRLGLEAGQEIEFHIRDDGSVEVRPKRPALERLRDVRASIADRAADVDVEAIRRESKRAWEAVDDGPGRAP